jgi:hypothetical protein
VRELHLKSTLAVLVVAALGVATLVVLERGGPAEADPRDRLVLEDHSLPVDRVDRIELRRRDETPLVFARRAGGWEQVEPFGHPMDPFSIRQLAQQAAGLVAAARLDPEMLREGRSLAALGLDPPQAVIEYRWADGTLALELGRRGVAGRAYLRVAGEPDVWVVDQALHERAVDMEPREWRDRRIFQGVGIESDRIEWAFEGQVVELVRRRKTWEMSRPVATRLDPVTRDELFDAIGRARGAGFILDEPDDLAAFGLAEPLATLTVETTRPVEREGRLERETDVQRLLVGAPVGAGSSDRFGLVEGRPTVIRVPSAVLAAFFPAVTALADPTGCGARPEDVKLVHVSTATGELRFERDLDVWTAPDHGGARVDAALVEALLDQLTSLRAPVVELAPYPHELEVALVILHGFDRRPITTVRIVRDPETSRWAMENGDGVLRVFPDSLDLRLTLDAFGLE